MPYSPPCGSGIKSHQQNEQLLIIYDVMMLDLTNPEDNARKWLTSFAHSYRAWSYSLRATRKMMEVTFSKQWIHFRLSDFWPPTSTILQKQEVLNYKMGHSQSSIFSPPYNYLLPEYDCLEVKDVLNDACGWNSDSQNILNSWQVKGCRYSVKVIEVTSKQKKIKQTFEKPF